MSKRFGRIDLWKIKRISNRGERVLHLYPNDCYFVHLSIYHFALRYCQNAQVLDAGCGTGYGAHYLSDHGAASVLAIDNSSTAVTFARNHFREPNLEFRQMDISRIEGLPERYYDVIFSSNALEHVSEITSFFYTASLLLKPGGSLILAVPPITSEELRQANVSNPFHLHIWSPLQWQHFLSRYFKTVEMYRHLCSRSDVQLDFANGPDRCEITEKDFEFPSTTLEEMETEGTMTAIFVAHDPRSIEEIPRPETDITFVDDSFSRPSPPSNLFSKMSRAAITVRRKFFTKNG